MRSGIEYGLTWKNHGVALVKDQVPLTASTFMAIVKRMVIMGTSQ
jgi:hypothetical protein